MVPVDVFSWAFPHDFVALIAQVLKLPSRIDFIAAVMGLLPELTLANRTLLKQGAGPPKIELASTPPSWNCNGRSTRPGTPAKPGPLTFNPCPGASAAVVACPSA